MVLLCYGALRELAEIMFLLLWMRKKGCKFLPTLW